MKKRILLLAIIPALAALSGCNSISAQKETGADLFIEDTLAHDEVFEKVVFKKPDVRRLSPVVSSTPAIAIQTANESAGYISIRFVAAVKITGGLTDATAVWTRTMFQSDGHVKEGKERDEKPCTSAYTSLADSGEADGVLTIDEFNNGVTDYTHFVVYTMRNIPISGENDASDYYLNAYLTLNDGGETTSKVVATTVDQKTRLAFGAGKAGCFGVKKSASSGFTTFDKAEGNKANHWASFANISLNEGDSFVLVNRAVDANKSNDFFAVYGYERLRARDNAYEGHPYGFYGFRQEGESQFSVCPENNKYYFYVENETNRIEPKYSLTKTIKLNPGVWDSTGSPWYAVNITNTGLGQDGWYRMTKNNSLYECTIINVPDDASIIFCRMNPNSSDLNWDNKWNQSKDLSALDTGNNTFTISDWNSDVPGKSSGSWGN